MIRKGTPHSEGLSRFKVDFDRFGETKNGTPVFYTNFSKKKIFPGFLDLWHLVLIFGLDV